MFGNFKDESVLTNGSVFKNILAICSSHLGEAFTTAPSSLCGHVKLSGSQGAKALQQMSSTSACSSPADTWGMDASW